MSIIDTFLKRRGFVKREDIERQIDDDDDAPYTKSAGFMPLETATYPQNRPDAMRILDFKTFVEAYRQLPWLYAAASAVMVAARKPTLKVFKEIKNADGSTDQEEVTGEDINMLIEAPNPDMSYIELIQITVLNLYLLGNMYWELVGTSETRPISESHRPIELWWIKPEAVQPVPDTNGMIVEYIYTSPYGKEKPIEATHILHFKQANPASYFLGMSPIEPLTGTCTLEFKARRFNEATLDNDGTPPFVFTHPKDVDDVQRRRFWHDWDARHKGPGKAGRAGMIWGGMDVKPLSTGTLKDMQYAEMRKMNREEMLAAGGVPPSIVGLLEYANYSNMEVQSKKFWQDTVIPLLDLVADKMTLKLAPHFNKDYWFEFDYSNIEVLQEDDERKSRIAASLIASGIKSPNEIRAEMFNDEPYEGGDLIYMSMSLIPVGSTKKGWLAEQEAADAEKEAALAAAAAAAANKPKEEVPPALAEANAQKEEEAAAAEEAKRFTAYMDTAERSVAAVDAAEDEVVETRPSFWRDNARKERLWQAFEKRVSASERALMPEILKFMRTQALSVKREIDKATSVASVTAASVFNVEAEVKKYVNKFFARYRVAFERAAEAGLHATKGKLWIPPEERRIKDNDDFHVSEEHLKKLRAQMNIAADHIFSTTYDLIDNDIALATANNLTVEQLAQSIYQHLDTYSIEHSRLVARTEMARTENWAGLEGYKENEQVDMKGWMCSFVEDSREPHKIADEQEVPLDADFNVDGESLEYPGDMRGSAGNVCNCLCTTYPVVSVV